MKNIIIAALVGISFLTSGFMVGLRVAPMPKKPAPAVAKAAPKPVDPKVAFSIESLKRTALFRSACPAGGTHPTQLRDPVGEVVRFRDFRGLRRRVASHLRRDLEVVGRHASTITAPGTCGTFS